MSYVAEPLPTFHSSAVQAFKSVFESPNWLMNVVWLSLAALAQSVFVGYFFLLGWGTHLLAHRAGRPERQLPDIDPNELGNYFMKGVWPFLVLLALQVIFTVLAIIPVIMVAAVGAFLGDVPLAMFAIVFIVPLTIVLVALTGLVTVPVLLRAMVSQDFIAAFDLQWCREFVRIMFWDILIQGFLFCLLSFLAGVLGSLALCVGYIPAMGIVTGASMHLLAQWYELYLSRGGLPAPPPASDDPIINATIV